MSAIREHRMMAHDEHSVIVVALDDVFKFEEKVTILINLVIVRIAIGFVIGVKPPLGVEHDESEAIGQLEGVGAGEAVIWAEDIFTVEMSFDKIFLALEGIQAMGVAPGPVMVAWNEKNLSLIVFNGLQLSQQTLFGHRTVYSPGIRETTAIDVIAKKNDSAL